MVSQNQQFDNTPFQGAHFWYETVSGKYAVVVGYRIVDWVDSPETAQKRIVQELSKYNCHLCQDRGYRVMVHPETGHVGRYRCECQLIPFQGEPSYSEDNGLGLEAR